MYFPFGQIIAFEGLDCSFKETNYQKFLEKFKKKFSDVSLVDINDVEDEVKRTFFKRTSPIKTCSFPRYDQETSWFVKKWLDGSYDRSMLKANPEIVNTFYALDRFDFWHKQHTEYGLKDGHLVTPFTYTMKELYDHGACFIFDRYTTSNAIYNPVNGTEVQREDLIYDAHVFCPSDDNKLIPQPNIVVWMRMRSFDVLLESIARKQNKDQNELDKDYLHEIWVRSEKAITDRVYQSSSIKLINIEVLDENLEFKSREKLEDEVWIEVMTTFCRHFQD